MEEFNQIIDQIKKIDDIEKLKSERHHGITRYDHSLRVAKGSYKISKILRFKDIKGVTEAAFLHDFYFDNQLEGYTSKERLSVHPMIALANAAQAYELNNVQRNIIEAHMYPLAGVKPNCKESLCVSLVDKTVATYEMIRYKLSNNIGVYVIFLFNFFK